MTRKGRSRGGAFLQKEFIEVGNSRARKILVKDIEALNPRYAQFFTDDRGFGHSDKSILMRMFK